MFPKRKSLFKQYTDVGVRHQMGPQAQALHLRASPLPAQAAWALASSQPDLFYPPTPGRWYLVQWWILHMPKRMAGQVARIHGVLYNALFFYRVIWKTLWHLEHPLFGNSKKKYRKEEKNNSLNIIQNILQHSSLSSISYFNISFHFSSSSIILSFHFIQLSLSYHFIRKGILKLFMIN